jgi:hypothetical protein
VVIKVRDNFAGHVAPVNQNQPPEEHIMKIRKHSLATLVILALVAALSHPSTSHAVPPVASCKNATLAAGPDCSAELDISAIDNGSFDPDGDPFFLSFDPPGPFSKGSHTVTLTATDSNAESSSCTATVTVRDTTPPIVLCPGDVDLPNTPGQCSAPASYSLQGIIDNCPGPYSSSFSRPSGSVFNVGATTVTVTVFDATGNRSTCTFMVTIHDTEPPSLTSPCPDDITVQAEKDQTTVVVSYTTPTASDNCAGVTVACDPPSDSAFPIGETHVTCTATDAHDNTASCGFTVTVLPPPGCQTIDDLIELVEKLELNKGTKNSLLAKLRSAQRADDRSRGNATANKVRAFNNEVRAMKQSGRLDAETAEELISCGSDIREDLRDNESR